MKARALALVWALTLFPASRPRADAGRDGFQFLTNGAGARSAAMGETGASSGGDVESAFINPGALAFIRAREASLSHAPRPLGGAESALAFVHPAVSGSWALRAFTRSHGDIPGYDGSGGPAPSYDARDSVFTLGYGRSFRWVGAGLALKRVQQSLAGRSAAASALDLGLLAPWRGTPFAFSLGARNLGPKASFDKEKTSLPRRLDAGVSARLFSSALLLTLEGHDSSEGALWNAGLEAWAHNVLAFRAGLDGSREAGGGVSCGLGIRLKSLQIDYAFVPMGDTLGALHRMGISFRFGGSGEAAYQRGLALAQRGAHAEAILEFKEALDAEPGHRGAAGALRESIRNLEAERNAR